jgi:outer membrane biosynthesis protein TonB
VTARRPTALLLAALAVVAIGCGDDEPKIPRADAAELRSALLEAKRRLTPLRCGDLSEDSLPKLEARAAQLPEGDARDSVEEGIEHLRSLVEAECTAREPEEQDTTPDTTEPETTTPDTTEPDTTEPEPEPQPEPEPEPQPEPEPEPDQGDGNDGGGQAAPSGAVRPNGKRGKKKAKG